MINTTYQDPRCISTRRRPEPVVVNLYDKKQSDIKFHIFTKKEFARYARARMTIIIVTIALCSFYLGHWYGRIDYRNDQIKYIASMVGKVNPPALNKTDSKG